MPGRNSGGHPPIRLRSSCTPPGSRPAAPTLAFPLPSRAFPTVTPSPAGTTRPSTPPRTDRFVRPDRHPASATLGFVRSAHPDEPLRAARRDPMPAPDRRRARLGVERLEDRAVPAAAFDPGRVLVTYADAADHLADLRVTPISASATKLTAGVYAVALAPGAAVAGAAKALAGLPGVRAAG